MSRLGKKPIPVPSGVTATVKGQEVNVKGPKGTLNFRAHDDVAVAFGDGQITVKPRHETPRARALW
ncbi:50S ribosomal protein L6, partial [Lacticaseibacillus rhamnosus]